MNKNQIIMKTGNIFENTIYNENKPIISILFETNFTKEIKIVMQQGTEMKEHKTSFPIVIHIIEGEIDFGVNQQTKQLKKGDLIALESNIPHNLKATKNSVIRLTLTKEDTTKRVKEIVNN